MRTSFIRCAATSTWCGGGWMRRGRIRRAEVGRTFGAGKGADGEGVARRPVRSSPLAGRRLPSAGWFHGPSPKLPSLTSFVVVKQSATVSSRSVLAHAGHETSQLRRPVPIGAPQPPHPRLCGTAVLCLGGKIEVTDERASIRMLVGHFNLFP